MYCSRKRRVKVIVVEEAENSLHISLLVHINGHLAVTVLLKFYVGIEVIADIRRIVRIHLFVHERGQHILRGIDHGDLPNVIVTNYVAAEVLNSTREKLGAGTANGMLDRLVGGIHFGVEHAP